MRLRSTLILAASGLIVAMGSVEGQLPVGTTVPVGRRPVRAAVSADGRYGYVPVQGADRVAIIDLPAGTLAGALSVPYLPEDIAASPDGKFLFVTSMATPTGFAFPPDDCSTIVVPSTTGKLTAIDTTSQTIAFEVPVTSDIPKVCRITRRGDRAFVLTFSTVETLDLATRATVDVHSLGSPTVRDAVLHPDDRRLYIVGTGASPPDLAILDGATGILSNFSFAAQGYGSFFGGRPTLDPSGRYLFFNGMLLSNLSRATLVFDTLLEELRGAIPGGFGGIVFSADGAKVYLFSPEFAFPQGVVARVADLAVVGTLPVGGYPAVLSGDRTKAFLSQTAATFGYLIMVGDQFKFLYDLTVVDLDSTSFVRQDLAPDLIQCSAAREIALSPDGQALVVTNPALDSVTVFQFHEPPVGSSFYSVPPCRLLDTRYPTFGVPNRLGGPALSGGTTRSFPVSGFCGIPTTARAVSANVTVTEPSDAGHLALDADAGSASSTSTINYRAGQTRANNATLRLGPLGTVTASCIQPSGIVHLILDVSGYWQ
ncbi:MAG TPA: hypothetical protein VKE50_07425 [Thermoanaerobaculia bacterium]|nr:hypothetical protein [Thermoanaerobaculia bacterium]